MDLDDPAGGSSEDHGPPPSAEAEVVPLLVPSPMPPLSTVLSDPLPWTLSSSPIYSPPRCHHMLPTVVNVAGDGDLEGDGEMMPASYSFRLSPSWSPMGVDMLWSFGDAHISYPEMSSGAPKLNLVAVASLAAQLNASDNVTGTCNPGRVTESVATLAIIPGAYRGWHFLSCVIGWIQYTKRIINARRKKPQNNTNGGCRIQQLEKGRKGISGKQHSRGGSVVWLHFSKNSSNDSGTVRAVCKYCNKALKAPSNYGTSHLSRHLESVHQMDLSAQSEALKEPQRSSCSQVLQTREIAENATPLTENNKIVIDSEKIELGKNDVKVQTGDISRKRTECTSGSKSEVWLHFEKLVPLEDSDVVKAKCIYCDKVFKADSRRNGTSRLRRHITDFHNKKLARSLIIKKRQSKKKKEEASRHPQPSQRSSFY